MKIKSVPNIVEKNYEQIIRVDKMAQKLALNRPTLERRFKKATTNTVTDYVQRVKVETAKKRPGKHTQKCNGSDV